VPELLPGDSAAPDTLSAEAVTAAEADADEDEDGLSSLRISSWT